MGGKKTTNNNTYVTNTGLGDSQYTSLNSGITGLGSQIKNSAKGTNTKIDGLSTKVGDNFKATTKQIGTLGTDQAKGFADATTLANSNTNLLGGRIDGVGTAVGGVANQVTGIGTQLTDVGSNVGAARADIATGFANTGSQLNDLSGQVGGVGTQVGAARNDIAQGFTNTGTQLTGLATGLGAARNDIAQGFTNTGTQLTGLSSDVGAARNDIAQGFTNTGTQLTGLSSDVGAVGTAVDNLTDGTVAGFEYTNDNIDARTNAIYDNQTQGFTGLSDLVGDGFTANSAQMTDYQKNIMMGQGKLNDALTAASQKQDNYYTGLAAGQEGIRGAVGGVQTGLNDFTAQYTRDAAQDLSDRRNLMAGVTNSTAMIRNDIGRTADATQRSLMQNVGGIDQPAQSAPTPQGGLTPTAVGGFREPGPNQTAQMSNSLDNARTILSTMGDQLDPSVRNQYLELVSAFDARGALIPQGIDQGGAFVSRMMDGDSNLVINKFNGSGQPLGRTGFNVNQLLAAADSFGANAQPAAMGLMR